MFTTLSYIISEKEYLGSTDAGDVAIIKLLTNLFN